MSSIIALTRTLCARIFCARLFVVTIFVSLRRRLRSLNPLRRRGEKESERKTTFTRFSGRPKVPIPPSLRCLPRCARCVFVRVCAPRGAAHAKGLPGAGGENAGERAGKGKIREGSSGKAKVKGKNEAHISGPAYDADDDDDGDAGDTHTRKTKDSSTVSPPPYRAPDRLPLARAANCFRRTQPAKVTFSLDCFTLFALYCSRISVY